MCIGFLQMESRNLLAGDVSDSFAIYARSVYDVNDTDGLHTRETDRQTVRQTETERQRETERDRDRQTERQTDRDRQTGRKSE